MRFGSGQEFLDCPNKSVTVIGMSGVGKTTLANMARGHNWFTYNVDYRIGTRYMGEHIVDSFKREAMKVPMLAKLLRSDSIYISSNITFDNLSPLSTYLGKPGNPALGGISFDEYKRRQAQHRQAEIAAMCDMPLFREKAREIYGYDHFLCDTSGSLCEVVGFDDADDPVLKTLDEHTMIVYIRGNADHTKTLIERFSADPKPMYYLPSFLEHKWAEYKSINSISNDDDVDPDAFIVWGFEQLVEDRLPRYERIAAEYGFVIDMDDVPELTNEQLFIERLARAIDAA